MITNYSTQLTNGYAKVHAQIDGAHIPVCSQQLSGKLLLIANCHATDRNHSDEILWFDYRCEAYGGYITGRSPYEYFSFTPTPPDYLVEQVKPSGLMGKFFRENPHTEVLELGPGMGGLMKFLSESHGCWVNLTCVDLSPYEDMLEMFNILRNEYAGLLAPVVIQYLSVLRDRVNFLLFPPENLTLHRMLAANFFSTVAQDMRGQFDCVVDAYAVRYHTERHTSHYKNVKPLLRFPYGRIIEENREVWKVPFLRRK